MLRHSEMLAMTIEEVVAWAPGAREALSRHGIDLCRCYHLSVHCAARIHGVDPAQVSAALLALQADKPAMAAARA